MFWFKWAEIRPDKKTYWESEKTYYPWVFHDDGIEPHGNYVRNMHSMRIPYPIEEKQMYYVNDFRVLHLAYLSTTRVEAKRRFYKFVDWEMNKRSIITLSRSYCQTKKTEKIYTLPPFFLYSKEINGFDLFELINTKSTMHWFDNYIVNRLPFHKPEEIYKLDLWDKEFLKEYNLDDKRTIFYHVIHYYLDKTQYLQKNILVRLVDKILRKTGI